MAAIVNARWKIVHPVERDNVLAAVAVALQGSDVTTASEDGPLGGLGIPRWSVVIFSAAHGDGERLDRELAALIEGSTAEGRIRPLAIGDL